MINNLYLSTQAPPSVVWNALEVHNQGAYWEVWVCWVDSDPVWGPGIGWGGPSVRYVLHLSLFCSSHSSLKCNLDLEGLEGCWPNSDPVWGHSGLLAAHVVLARNREWTGNIVPVGQNAPTQGDKRDCRDQALFHLILSPPGLHILTLGPPALLMSGPLAFSTLLSSCWGLWTKPAGTSSYLTSPAASTMSP